MARLILQIFGALSAVAALIFGVKLLSLFSEANYNEFTGLVAMVPAIGACVCFLLAVLFFGASFLFRPLGENSDQ